MRCFHNNFLSTAAIAATMLACGVAVAHADDDDGHSRRHGYKHVLLISVDGMHAVDLKRWVESRPGGNFAQLTGKGVVQRIITDLAVIDVVGTPEQPRLRLVETAPGVSEEQVRDLTGAELAQGLDRKSVV